MKKAPSAILATVLALGTGMAFARPADQASQTVTANDNNQRLEQRLSGEVRHKLAMIPEFGIFDNLTYQVDGGTVTLGGQVRNAFIKSEAENSVKHLEGIERVNNRIEILPASFNDDRIRRQVAWAVFHNAPEYAIQPVPPIHIIVKNGHVDLVGVVRNQTDKNLTFIRANGVPGVFSVDNNLQVEHPATKG
ncbi:MAG: BON domain-containing protein [Candidatus Angelobacter sp.]